MRSHPRPHHLHLCPFHHLLRRHPHPHHRHLMQDMHRENQVDQACNPDAPEAVEIDQFRRTFKTAKELCDCRISSMKFVPLTFYLMRRGKAVPMTLRDVCSSPCGRYSRGQAPAIQPTFIVSTHTTRLSLGAARPASVLTMHCTVTHLPPNNIGLAGATSGGARSVFAVKAAFRRQLEKKIQPSS